MPEDQIDHAYVALHKTWQEHISVMIANGSSYEQAAESMLTVALAAKVQIDGSFETARSLYVLGMGLAGLVGEKATHLH